MPVGHREDENMLSACDLNKRPKEPVSGGSVTEWSGSTINQKDDSLVLAKGSHCPCPASGIRVRNTVRGRSSRGFLSKKTRDDSSLPQAEMSSRGQSGIPRKMHPKRVAQPRLPAPATDEALGSYVAPKRRDFQIEVRASLLR